MSEMSSGSAANSTSRPDPAAGDMPAESDLPATQGLDSGVSSGTIEKAEAADADLADDAGSVSETAPRAAAPARQIRCRTLPAPAAAEPAPVGQPQLTPQSRRGPVRPRRRRRRRFPARQDQLRWPHGCHVRVAPGVHQVIRRPRPRDRRRCSARPNPTRALRRQASLRVDWSWQQ